MKIQCELCREIVPIGAFSSSSEGIEIRCEACGEVFFVAAGGQGEGGRDEGGQGPGPGQGEGPGQAGRECPKCGKEAAEGAEACGACGLRVELFEEFAADLEREEEQAPEELRALWEACEAHWGDESAHDRFIEAASSAGAYAFAARRYRAALRRRQADQVAAERLSRISRMAEAALLSASADRSDAESEEQPYKGVLVVLIVLVLLAGGGGVYLMVQAASKGG